MLLLVIKILSFSFPAVPTEEIPILEKPPASLMSLLSMVLLSFPVPETAAVVEKLMVPATVLTRWPFTTQYLIILF